MTTPPILKRADLDRLKVASGAEVQVPLVCLLHPEEGTDAFYTDGHVRLLCKGCGFELVKIEVAE